MIKAYRLRQKIINYGIDFLLNICRCSKDTRYFITGYVLSDRTLRTSTLKKSAMDSNVDGYSISYCVFVHVIFISYSFHNLNVNREYLANAFGALKSQVGDIIILILKLSILRH